MRLRLLVAHLQQVAIGVQNLDQAHDTSLVSGKRVLARTRERRFALRQDADLDQCLTGLVAAAYSEVLEPRSSSVFLSRKLQIKQYVEERLHDPQLRPAAVARRFGISPRYLRLIFESDGEPLSTYLLRRRLEKCAQVLRDRAWAGQTITEIAFRHGFNDLTHFGSAFRKRFGLAPRDYRRASRVPPCSSRARIDPRA